MTSFDRRPKGRNNSRRNGRRNYARPSHVIKLNEQGRSFNHQRVKFNGNASKLYEKYKKLALESLSTGDKILAESYFQHADHFARMLPSQVVTNGASDNKATNENSIANSEEELSEHQADDSKNESDDDSTVVAKSITDS
tara:strand:- start:23 stop:442 length:420 start_codon:yes stop_codon:yes gene_type:complete